MAEADSGGSRRWWSGDLAEIREYLLPRKPEYEPQRWRKLWLYIVFVARRWLIEDRAGGLAATLTVHTLLSMVPLMGVALVGLSFIGDESGGQLLERIIGSLVPESSRATELTHAVLNLAGNVTVTKLGYWGFFVALGIAFVLFSVLEGTFNRIWRVLRKRNVVVKFTMFYALATLGPLLIFYSLAQPLVAGFSRFIAWPILTTTVGMVMLNRYMPFTTVRWRSAAVGGVLSAVLFELGKLGFGTYVSLVALETYEGVYGPLLTLPIFIIWSQLSWMVLLLGAEVSFAVQHTRAIELQGFINRYVLDAGHVALASGQTAARLLLAICDSYDRRARGITHEALAERFRMNLDQVGDIVGRLEESGYLLEIDRPDASFVPARPLDQIRLFDVLSVFDEQHARNARDDGLATIFSELDGSRERIAGDTTYQELVAAGRRSRPGAVTPVRSA